MEFRSAEDRLNPLVPEGADDATLGGYQRVYGRAAAFEGCDGEPYTVGVEAEETGDPARPWAAYLVFIRWAPSGTAIMGHLETDDLAHGATEAEARGVLEALPLRDARAVLDETILRRQRDDHDARG
jgi:hypothetical protein